MTSAQPPGSWKPARRIASALLGPLERFLRIEASSGIVLLSAALVALAWANSPWSSAYDRLWHAPITLGVGPWISSQSLHFWINDGLMTIFFLVVGLEIRREIQQGELSEPKRAILPVAAAIGGMLVPALIYLALNTGPPSRQGWGVPMATDIAFAVGVLALLGSRVPAALRVLLLALAIIDDIGAILVIAVFYSSGIEPYGLLLSGGGIALTLAFQRLGVRRAVSYLLPGGLVWLGMLITGVHPTIAGVIMGLLTPVQTWFGSEGFLSAAGSAIEDFRHETEREDHNTHDLILPLRQIKQAEREALPPVVRIEAALHPWVAYGIMPLFALANAGVGIGELSLGEEPAMNVALGIGLGLVLGKPAGIVLLSFVTVKLGWCVLPRGTTWSGVLLVGVVAGIGFTMAIFIAGLAFPDGALLGAAKLAVLGASAVAGTAGVLLGWLLLPRQPLHGAASSASDAEQSTER